MRQTGAYRDRQRVVCHVCGLLWHFGKDYFKDRPGSGRGRGQGRGFQNQKPRKGPGKQRGIKSSSENSGLFVAAQICEKSVKWLVDTGATLTILNTNLYNTVKSSLGGDNELQTVKKKVLSATNEPIKVSGKTEKS